MPSAWEFVLALPNLRLRADRLLENPAHFPSGIDFESARVTIVGGEEPLTLEVRRESTGADRVLRSFRDEYGEPYVPAAMLVKKMASSRLKKSAQAFNDFRNAAALSFVLRGRAAHAMGNGQFDPNWSDTFDFHPAQLNRGGGVVLQSPALLNLVLDEDLFLAPSPAISPFSQELHPDRYLYRCFGAEWKLRYVNQAKKEQFGTALFRALEVAYQAASIGTKSYGSAIEYGSQVALWVSAMEILAWPAQNHANLGAVLALLRKATENTALRRRRYTIKWGKQVLKGDAVQWCYWLLYNARNQFLHGNPVDFATLTGTSRGKKFGLTRSAALLFRFALVAYLSSKYPRVPTTLENFDESFLDFVDDEGYVDGMARLLGVRE